MVTVSAVLPGVRGAALGVSMPVPVALTDLYLLALNTWDGLDIRIIISLSLSCQPRPCLKVYSRK